MVNLNITETAVFAYIRRLQIKADILDRMAKSNTFRS
jgi:hypothetical protein